MVQRTWFRMRGGGTESLGVDDELQAADGRHGCLWSGVPTDGRRWTDNSALFSLITAARSHLSASSNDQRHGVPIGTPDRLSTRPPCST